jgi:hypothetical protein
LGVGLLWSYTFPVIGWIYFNAFILIYSISCIKIIPFIVKNLIMSLQIDFSHWSSVLVPNSFAAPVGNSGAAYAKQSNANGRSFVFVYGGDDSQGNPTDYFAAFLFDEGRQEL